MDRIMVLLCGIFLIIDKGYSKTGGDTTNLALSKPVKMSGTFTYQLYGADHFQGSLAVDGNAELVKWPPPWSCALTLPTSSYSWLYVDLMGYYEVLKVTLTGRNDTNSLERFNIFLLASEPRMLIDTTYPQGQLCASESGTVQPGQSKTYPCAPPNSVRYVVVQKTVTSKQLAVCEIQVYGTAKENIALNKRTEQDSLYTKNALTYTPNMAVDGDRSNRHYSGKWSCSLTARTPGLAWWMVELRQFYTVKKVVITNRRDAATTAEFIISLHPNEPIMPLEKGTAGPNGKVCAVQIGNLSPGVNKLYHCPTPNLASFLVIQQTVPNHHLQLCEVEVFGELTDPLKATCPQRFIEVYAAGQGYSSSCEAVAWMDQITFAECVQLACNVSANVATYVNEVCYVRACEGNDLQITTDAGGWNIVKLADTCWLKFKLVSAEKRQLKSRCPESTQYNNVSLDMCRQLACEEKSSNTINYRDRNCSVLTCTDGDPQLVPAEMGWVVFHKSDLVRDASYGNSIDPTKTIRDELNEYKLAVGILVAVYALTIALVGVVVYIRKKKGKSTKTPPEGKEEGTYDNPYYLTPAAEDIERRSTSYEKPQKRESSAYYEKTDADDDSDTYEDTGDGAKNENKNLEESPPELPYRNRQQ